jgi:hypothetical protein
MKPIIRILTVTLVTIMISFLAIAREEGVRSKTFNVTKGGTIEVSTSVGDIRISTWEKNEVDVTVEGLDDEDLKNVKMTQSGNVVRVSYRSRWSDWSGSGHIRFDINIPSQFNLDLSTSGGDLEVKGGLTGKIDGSTSGGSIKLGNVFAGPIDVSTSGGDISTGKLEGEGHLKTAGGDIHVGAVNGSLYANTAGGNIQVETVTKTLEAKTAGGDINIGDVGGEARVSTSGGDVNVGKVSGKATLSTSGGDIELNGASGKVSARTSGGDLRLQGITGSIDAKTSGGGVEAELIPSGKGGSRLSSAGGDVRLYIDEKSKATIEATIRLDGWGWKKSRYVVKSDFPKETYETDEDGGEIRAVYKLNGGGELIELSTSNSNIEIHKLR